MCERLSLTLHVHCVEEFSVEGRWPCVLTPGLPLQGSLGQLPQPLLLLGKQPEKQGGAPPVLRQPPPLALGIPSTSRRSSEHGSHQGGAPPTDWGETLGTGMADGVILLSLVPTTVTVCVNKTVQSFTAVQSRSWGECDVGSQLSAQEECAPASLSVCSGIG